MEGFVQCPRCYSLVSTREYQLKQRVVLEKTINQLGCPRCRILDIMGRGEFGPRPRQYREWVRSILDLVGAIPEIQSIMRYYVGLVLEGVRYKLYPPYQEPQGTARQRAALRRLAWQLHARYGLPSGIVYRLMGPVPAPKSTWDL